jgi:hypothetical protein
VGLKAVVTSNVDAIIDELIKIIQKNLSLVALWNTGSPSDERS